MKILLFGMAKDIVGEKELLNYDSMSGNTVNDLLIKLRSDFPDLNNINSLAVGVNQHYAEASTVLNDNDVVALIPPVSGG